MIKKAFRLKRVLSVIGVLLLIAILFELYVNEKATALGLFKAVIAFVLIVIANKICRRLGGEGIW